MAKSQTPASYLDLKGQSNRDIRETMSTNPKPSNPPIERKRLDNPKRRLKSVVHRVPQGSQPHKENQPPSTSKASPYQSTINNVNRKSQDIREHPNYRPSTSTKWPTLYGTKENSTYRPSSSSLPRKLSHSKKFF